MHVAGTWNLEQAASSTSVIRCSGSKKAIKKEEANLPFVVAVNTATSFSTFAEDT